MAGATVSPSADRVVDGDERDAGEQSLGVLEQSFAQRESPQLRPHQPARHLLEVAERLPDCSSVGLANSTRPIAPASM